MPKKPMILTCASHGRASWSGAVICPTCKTIYQTHDEHAERYAPEICCKVPLMSKTALPVCDTCAKEAGLKMPDLPS